MYVCMYVCMYVDMVVDRYWRYLVVSVADTFHRGALISHIVRGPPDGWAAAIGCLTFIYSTWRGPDRANGTYLEKSLPP